MIAKLVSIVLCIGLSLGMAQAKVLHCAGTEPFWSADIDMAKSSTLIRDANRTAPVQISTKIISAAGTSSTYAFVAQGKYTSLAVLHNATCSDGMSDQKYKYSVMMLGYAKQPMIGCCR